MSKTATMYLRCSTQKQLSGGGLDRQLRYCRRWCEDNGVEEIGMVVDVGSGYDGNHLKDHRSRFQGNLGRILDAYDYGLVEKPDYFIYEESDRLSRDYIYRFATQGRLENMGIIPYSVGMGDTPEGFWKNKLPPEDLAAIHKL